jgi:hypothetical protein
MHSSQTNNKSSLSSFTRDLETFENAYSVLLDKAKEKYIEYYKGGHDPNSHWDIQRKYLGSEFDLSRNLLGIYRYFIGVNMMRLLFNYPPQTEDPQISEKMFSVFLIRIREIHLKLLEVMKKVITIENNYNEFADIFLNESAHIHFSVGGCRLDKFLISLFETFRYIDMEKEIRDVLHCLLTLSKDLFPTDDLHLILRQNGIMLKKL